MVKKIIETSVITKKLKQKKTHLIMLNEIIAKYKDSFCLVSYSEADDYYLLAKKQKFTVTTLNENNFFMPHEKKEDKEVAMLFLLSTGNCKKKIPLLSNIRLLKSIKIVMLPNNIKEIEQELLKLGY